MKTAIVTGATGFVGRWLVRELLNKEIEIYAIIRPESKRREYLPQSDKLHIIEIDMRDYDKIHERIFEVVNVKTTQLDDCVFYHLAWDGVYGPDRTNLDVQFLNIKASKWAAAGAEKIGCTKFIGLGSIMELESEKSVTCSGIRATQGYVYGQSKSLAHVTVSQVLANSKTGLIWPFLSNPFGEYDDSDRFIKATLKKIIAGDKLKFSEGKQLYDFVYIKDAVRALYLLGMNSKPYERYFIGSGNPNRLKDYVTIIINMTDSSRELSFGTMPYSSAVLSKEEMSIETLTRDTGFKTETTFEEAITVTMDWLRKEYDNFETQQKIK